MPEEISLTKSEARYLFDRFGARIASIGLCFPRVGKCKGFYSLTEERCKVCRKMGNFLGVEYKEE